MSEHRYSIEDLLGYAINKNSLSYGDELRAELARLREIERDYLAAQPLVAQIRANVDGMPEVFRQVLRPFAQEMVALRAEVATLRPVRAVHETINRAIADSHALYDRWQAQLAVAPESTEARVYGYEYDFRWRQVLDLLPALRAWEEAPDPTAASGERAGAAVLAVLAAALEYGGPGSAITREAERLRGLGRPPTDAERIALGDLLLSVRNTEWGSLERLKQAARDYAARQACWVAYRACAGGE